MQSPHPRPHQRPHQHPESDVRSPMPATEEEWAMAYSVGVPIAGLLAGRRDEEALVDCLRVRFALALYPSRPN